MNFHASYHFPSTNEMIQSLGLEESGPVQKFFTNEVWRLSDEYVPFDTGMLKNNVMMDANGTSFTYLSIYAQYQWYGNLMVDPEYFVGAFPLKKDGIQVGFYSRKGVPKILDPNGRAMKQDWGGPLRGPYWTSRMWADRHEEIENAVQKFIERGAR